MEKFKTFKLPIHADERFTLIPLEVMEHAPFEVKRVYAIVDGKLPSGSHCHKVEQEVFFCVRGGTVAQIDEGSGMKDVVLKPGDAMYVGTYIWHHFETWQPGTVMVAVSSTPYNPKREDYITDYEEFKNSTK
ncbi:MAG: hypothetical protein UV52_C0019G0002 [Parcubacteria group bacterium GW2011_GWD1_42_9]|uniref:Sugar 3,4-ketoisomerase QdtA cupin domain-containing protein n=2 Tax=Candidatus Vebleniibacteriota TaxID=1817921 RepID=A0A1G2Q6Q9_9BACT|nr:MAG: hypothetical protein UV47_C0019G0008 [Parcubacteria group bacterium GW2011_GWA2_42_80]KKS79033.1 MAG: hypothetical protein UV52_C0019G0002 [Parcubacteria group bacterium GW2011_GWD1_42_9]OHA55581.1 MAG: hypothetical protein A2226_03450 [Candidatus Veblenbacteria bacterium RIFOXYA2_FULL_43_9]OHA56605.1 MAG: hypothetical protein A2441_02000 [Candidatus Veblenbacteria bacterium RIFOXYC2_FULL_42_11]HAO81514.1 hypothetical protein [Candidatus Veblenbacteria bacterium]